GPSPKLPLPFLDVETLGIKGRWGGERGQLRAAAAGRGPGAGAGALPGRRLRGGRAAPRLQVPARGPGGQGLPRGGHAVPAGLRVPGDLRRHPRQVREGGHPSGARVRSAAGGGRGSLLRGAAAAADHLALPGHAPRRQRHHLLQQQAGQRGHPGVRAGHCAAGDGGAGAGDRGGRRAAAPAGRDLRPAPGIAAGPGGGGGGAARGAGLRGQGATAPLRAVRLGD
ncbi:unnamed protein product, partial [Heterosigma akashiwo]